MRASPHRKQILLFLAAVVLPSMALTFLTLRIILQEKELAAKRLQEERSRRARAIGQALVARLDTIRHDEVRQQMQCDKALPCAHIHAETGWIAGRKDGRLVFPWESNPPPAAPAAMDPSAAALVRRAEAAEFTAGDPIKSADALRSVLPMIADPVRRRILRLDLARVLGKAGQPREATGIWREIAALRAEVTDEDGLPLSLWACEALIDHGDIGPDILNTLTTLASAAGWQRPIIDYRLRNLAEKMIARDSSRLIRDAAAIILARVEPRIQDMEAATDIQRLFPPSEEARGPEPQVADPPAWLLANQGRWFAGKSVAPENVGSFVITVRTSALLRNLPDSAALAGFDPDAVRFVSGSDASGEVLGPAFPNCRIAIDGLDIAGESNPDNTRPYLYGLTLLLVLGITMFGGYLLLRDVRREVRLAGLRSQFVAGVSHELKTPLTSIRMFADTLRLGRIGSSESREEYLNTIVNESERLSRLLNNVLDFSRIEEGRMEYQFVPVSVPEVIGAAAKAMSYPFEQQGFTLAISVAEGLPEIRADRDALIQALLNLLHNAVKFSGGSRRIKLSAARGETGITIRVTDFGIGIDAAEHKKIFERFYRAASSNPEKIPGTGLGLTIVSHIVHAHRGAIHVESSPGRGSTFSITLPLEQSS